MAPVANLCSSTDLDLCSLIWTLPWIQSLPIPEFLIFFLWLQGRKGPRGEPGERGEPGLRGDHVSIYFFVFLSLLFCWTNFVPGFHDGAAWDMMWYVIWRVFHVSRWHSTVQNVWYDSGVLYSLVADGVVCFNILLESRCLSLRYSGCPLQFCKECFSYLNLFLLWTM